MNAHREHNQVPSWRKKLYAFIGILSVGMGVLGVILPLLPHTPFFLLAAYLFSKSSPKLHHWLLHNKWFGRYIRDYKEGRGIPLRTKIVTIAFALVSLTVSFLLIDMTEIRWLLIVIAVTFTIYIAIKKSYRESDYK